MRSAPYRLELAQRAAIAVTLVCSVAACIAFYFEIKLPYVRWRWAATGIVALIALALLLSARCRDRQSPILKALVLTTVAAAGCAFADNVLFATLLAVGLSSVGYLAIQLFGFLFPM